MHFKETLKMFCTNPSELLSRLGKGEVSNLYYIYGNDISGVQKLTRDMLKILTEGNEDFSLTRLNGRNVNTSELYDTVQLMPMMSEYNCIFINDYNCEKPLDNMQGHKAEDLNKNLIEVLKSVPPQTVIIFNVTGFEIKMKFDRKSNSYIIADKNKKLFDYIQKNGVCCEVSVKNARELAKDICSKVAGKGSKISLKNAGLLAEMCLSDTLAIENEIDKLCSYVQENEITAEIIGMLVHRQSDMTVYKLANAVVSMNRNLAFEAIDELNVDKDNRVIVMSAVTAGFLDLYRAKCALQSGVTADSVVRDFSYGARSFAVRNAYRDCSAMSIGRLRKCIEILCDTTAILNSSAGADPKIMLEKAVAEMLAVRN